jgi:hypothetical protein
MSDQPKDTWVPHTDGVKVWAVNTRTGNSRQLLDDRSSRIVSVHSTGEEIGIVLANGRTRVWNPRTDSLRTFL